MRKKFLLMILILSLFSSMGGGYLYGQTDVTTVTSETDLASALAAGGDVQLGCDIEVNSTIAIPQNVKVTLDLNGKTIKANGEFYLIDNDGDLTIYDGGDGGTIEGLGLRTGYTITRSIDAKLTINSGIFKNIYSEGAALYVHNGDVFIYGGEFYGQNVAIANHGGIVDAKNCYIDGFNYAVNATSRTIISNSKISGKCILNEYIKATDVTFYQARIGDAADWTSYETLADAIAAAEAGDEVYVFAGTYAVPTMKAGITINGELDGDRKVVLEGTLSGTLEGLTLKNLHIKGANAQRWAYAKGNLNFENVTFEATSVYAIHFDGIEEGTNLLYKDCTIIGWAAMGGSPASCKFENCTIKDNGTYGVIRTYFNATIEDCTFDIRNANTNDVYQDGVHAVDGANVVVTECTNIVGDNGETGDMKDIVNVSGSSVINVDGVVIQNPAKVGDTYYATIQDAIVAAAPNGTVELLADVIVDKWIMFSESLNIGNGNIITTNINGLTINGGNHSLTVKSIESAGNGNRLFFDATNLNIKNLTINYTDAAANQGGIGLTSGIIENVIFNGGGYAIFPGTGEITVKDCTFKTNATSIYYEDERDNLVVTGNTFENPNDVNVILLRGKTTFTGNNVISGRTVNVVSGSPVVSGNDFNNVRFKVYNVATATISENKINNLEFSDNNSVVYSTFTDDNTLSEEAQTTLDAMMVAEIGDMKYGSLQVAIDAAVDGNTITLIKDVTENVTVTQKPDVKFTIDGAEKTMKGAIIVDGKTATYTSAGVTIKNVNFNASEITADACINLGKKGDNNTRYTCNVTVEACDFTAGQTTDKAAVKSYTGGDKNLAINKCNVDNTMHSLLQAKGIENVTISETKVYSKNGINLNNSNGNINIEKCVVDVTGYAVRTGENGSNSVSPKLTITESTLKSAEEEAIVIRSNTVTSSISMANNVVKVSDGKCHISGNTADTKISADANYWDGKTGPVVAEGSPQVVVNSYYKDEALTELVRIPLGDNFTAYTREDGIWGEVGGNAVKSFVIKVLDAEGNVMGTTSLNNIDGIIDGSVYVTWSLKLDAVSNTDEYWTMNWTTAPSINKMPAKVELWVDGVKVGGGDVVLNAPDNLKKIHAANIDADGKILAYRQTLEDAVNNSDNVAILVAGTYNVPTGKDLTITGAVDGVSFGTIGAVGMGGASVTFNNVTFNYADNSTYKGLQHSGNLVYNNCTFYGQVFLYGESETFNKCTFNQTTENYNVWTYGAKEVAFNECTFNSAGKSVLVYNEGACATDLTVEKTTFKATTAVDGKAAIEINTQYMPAGTEIVVDGATTAEGFSENTKSGSSLWNDKMVVEGAPNGGTNSKVTVDNVVVKEAAAVKLAGAGTEEDPYLINNIDDLVWFRYEVNDKGTNYQGKFVELKADIDLNNEDWTPIGNSTNKFQGTFDGQNHTISNLVIEGGSNSNQGFFGFTTNGEIKNLTINNAKVSGRLNVGVVAGTPYTSKYTNIKVTGHVEVNGMSYVGGVGGKNAYANWTDITVDVDGTSYVKATSTENGTAYRTYVGGVIGFNGEGGHTFKNITSNINVIGNVCDIGGIFGIAHYGNKFENITHAGTVTNTNSDAGDVAETGLIAGVWHNQAGTSVTFTNTTSTGTISVPNVTGVTFPNGGLIGAAYTTSKETSSTSGSLTINGEQVYPYVAKIGEVGYNTLAKAITAAQDKDVVTLLWVEGDAPIAMKASLYGKNVTITGTAEVDWSKGWFYVGRGGTGNATLTFDNANLTSASNSASTGIHVSGRQKDTDNKYDGTLVIKNSIIELDYLIQKNVMTLDNSTLTVKNGFSVGGRPASETESGADATATMTLNNNSKVVVNNHNGMGLGYEALGIMNINSGSTFETTQAFLVTAKGTMNVNGGNVKVVGTLTNNGTVYVTGESTLNITTLEGNSIKLNDGAIVKNSTVGGNAFVAGNVTFRGDNTFAMLYDYGTLTDYYGTTAPMKWNVEKDASLTLTEKARYGLGYGDEVTVIGSIENALEARENLTDADCSLFMHGLVAQESSGWNCNSKLTVENAYVVIGSNNSFGNKPGSYGGNYTFNFNNSVVDGSRITFYEANSKTEFTLTNSDVRIGTFMTRDTDSKFTLKNSKVLSTTETNGNDEGNYNAGELVLDKSSLEYSAAFTNTGVLNIGENSTLVAPEVTNTGRINFTALTSTLATPTGSLTINLNLDNNVVENPEDYKVDYKDGKYQVVEKVYVAKALVNGVEKQFESLQEAINAVAENGTVTLIKDETFTEDNRTENNGWYEGVYYTGDKSFTIDLDGHIIGQEDGSVNDYLLLFKNSGEKENTITLKKGTIDAGTTAYCALATSTSNEHKITINTEDINFVGNNSNGAVLKIRGGTELNVKAGTIITGNDNYVGIEAAGNGTVVNIYANTEIYQKGTTSYVGSLVGASYNATVNVYGGKGTSAKGGFIVMTSGGTINVSGGEWTANKDGTYANDNKAVLIAQNDNATYSGAGKSIVNVTGGTFKGGYNCYANETGNSQINISGGNFNANPTAYVIDGYDVEELSNGTYNVIPTSGTQTRELEAGWHWFSTYVDLSADGQNSLDVFKAAFVGDDNEVKVRQIKNQSGYVSYNSAHNIWVNGGLLSVTNTDMYMINMKKAHTLNLTGDFADRDIAITLNTGWNWIGYPVNEEINLVDALSDLEPSKGDVIKSQTKSAYWTGTKWKVEGGFERMIPGEGYKYSRKSSATSLVYNTDVKPTSKSDKGREDNHWMVNTIQYPGNMTMIAMLSVDGEIVKDNYEIAAFANGECRGSARPIYDEDLDAYVLLMTIQGEEVEELTFKYYDVNYGTEYELSNRINYSDDAIVGSFDEPYMFNLGILNIEESSIEQINIYPNPTTTNSEINLQAMCDKVEVFNALGVKVAEYSNVDSIDAIETAGIYVIRVTIDGNARNCRLVVK